MRKILFFEIFFCFVGWNLNLKKKFLSYMSKLKSAPNVLKFGVYLVYRNLRPMVKN